MYTVTTVDVVFALRVISLQFVNYKHRVCELTCDTSFEHSCFVRIVHIICLGENLEILWNFMMDLNVLYM